MSGRSPALHTQNDRQGTLAGAGAYALWGLFPLYFHALAPAGAWEILANRIVWSLLFCVLVLLVRRDFTWVRPVFGSPRRLGAITLASLLLATNWVIYVAAVVSHHVTEASLGYFLNPIVTVGLGVLVLRERLRPLQWVAVGIGLVAGVYLSTAAGKPPWIALSLAGSFALYALMKNRIGLSLGALHGFSTETAVLTPIALAVLGWLALHGGTTFLTDEPAHPLLLASSGVVTAIPLLLFATAARRVTLAMIGLLQFVTPVLQLLCGVLLLGEVMSPSRWAGFAIVWVALLVLTVDSVRAARAARSRSRALAAAESVTVCAARGQGGVSPRG